MTLLQTEGRNFSRIDQAGDSTYAGLRGPAGGTAADRNLSLVKTGPGTLTLAGANTYTGSTTVQGGVLQADIHDAIPAASPVTINSGAMLWWTAGPTGDDAIDVTAGVLSLSRDGIAPYSLLFGGPGELVIDGRALR